MTLDEQVTEQIASGLETLMATFNNDAKAEAAAKVVVTKAHPTNQQSVMRFCIAYIKAMAPQQTDARNEDAVRFARAVVKLPEVNAPLPYI